MVREQQPRTIPITTDLFKPQQREGLSQLRALTFEEGFVDRKNPNIRALFESARTQPATFLTTRTGKMMLREVNADIYAKLEETFHLAEPEADEQVHEKKAETGYGFWRKHMLIANEAVKSLQRELLPHQEKRFGLKNEVNFIQDPATVMWMLSSPEVDDKLKFELRRQVTIALSSAQLEIEYTALSEQLGDIQNWLNLDLFSSGEKLGGGTMRVVSYATDPITNEVLHVSGAEHNPYTLTQLPSNALEKEQMMGMRCAGEIGWVVTQPRLKDPADAVNKSIRNALESSRKDKGNTIDPKSVRDRGGIMFIVTEEFSSNGPKVHQLREKFKAILSDHFGLSPEAFIDDNNAYLKESQSPDFRVQKIWVQLPTFPYPIEVMFTGIGEQLNNDERIGNYDGTTGTFDGQAHALYKLRRDMDVLQLYFPKEYYGEINYDNVKRHAFRRVANDLLRSHISENQ